MGLRRLFCVSSSRLIYYPQFSQPSIFLVLYISIKAMIFVHRHKLFVLIFETEQRRQSRTPLFVNLSVTFDNPILGLTEN